MFEADYYVCLLAKITRLDKYWVGPSRNVDVAAWMGVFVKLLSRRCVMCEGMFSNIGLNKLRRDSLIIIQVTMYILNNKNVSGFKILKLGQYDFQIVFI